MDECQRCKGDRFVTMRLKDRSGKQPHGLGVEHTLYCPMCDGKGYITQEDRDAERRSWRLPPLPKKP